MQVRDIGEIRLIKQLTKGISLDKSVVAGIGDDSAVIKWTKDKFLLFTCDMLIENVHFQRDRAKPSQIGWKALARSISDIAAMGGVPRYALVSIAVHPRTPVSFVNGIYGGIKRLANRFRINLVGGDTSRSPKAVIDISLLGEVEKDNLITRSGAEEGDLIFVTGALGGATKRRHLEFVPRLDEARKLVKNFRVNSMIDISDGLALDLWRIAEASKLGFRIYADRIPVSKDSSSPRQRKPPTLAGGYYRIEPTVVQSHRWRKPLENPIALWRGSLGKALSEGEDFEILFTMSRIEAGRLLSKPSILQTRTMIGEMTRKRSGRKLVMVDGGEEELKPKGYQHF